VLSNTSPTTLYRDAGAIYFSFFFEIFEDTGTSKAPMILHLLGQASFESWLGCLLITL
jgi:hypothetical protein